MTFDYFLILLPVLLAVGALIRVLTLKSPTYHRKRKGDHTPPLSGSGADQTLNTPSKERSDQESNSSGSTSNTGDGEGGDGSGD